MSLATIREDAYRIQQLHLWSPNLVKCIVKQIPVPLCQCWLESVSIIFMPLLFHKCQYTCYLTVTTLSFSYRHSAAVESSNNVQQQLQLKLVKSLKEYRNLYVVQHRIGGRLIYPESLRYLPMFILAICKSRALCGSYVRCLSW